MHGQAAMEYIMIIMLVLGAIALMVYTVFSPTQESTRLLQAKQAVHTLKEEIDYVYNQGPGARAVVDVFIPQGTIFSGSYIGGGPFHNEINLQVYVAGKPSDVWEQTSVPVYGFWPNKTGPITFTIIAYSDYVLVQPAITNFIVFPGVIDLETNETIVTQVLTIKSSVNFTQNINVSAYGEIYNKTSFSTDTISLPPYGAENISVTIYPDVGEITGYIHFYTNLSSFRVPVIIKKFGNVSNATLCITSLLNITTWRNGSYLEKRYIFGIEYGKIMGINFEPNSPIQLDVIDSTGNSAPGFPTTIYSNNYGDFEYNFSLAGWKPGTYTIIATDGVNEDNKTIQVFPC